VPLSRTALPRPDYDVIVVGAGHNGLVCAAYLARAGLRTLLLEARTSVGGVAGSERFAGATVNVCNCDHVTFRTTPIADELDLARFGLRYLEIDPAQVAASCRAGRRGLSGTTSSARSTGSPRRIPASSTATAATCTGRDRRLS
jgi:phytoene dehydrogenase-like protein